MKRIPGAALILAIFFSPIFSYAQQIAAPTPVRSVPVALALPGSIAAPVLAPVAAAPTLPTVQLGASLSGLPSIRTLPSSALSAPAAPAPAAFASDIARPAASVQPSEARSAVVSAQPAASVRTLSAADAQEGGSLFQAGITKGVQAAIDGPSGVRSARISERASVERLDGLFDGALARKNAYLQAPFAGAVSPMALMRTGARERPESARLQRAAPADDAAIPWKEVEKVVRFASPEDMRRFEGKMKGEFRPHHPGDAEGWQDFLRQAFDLMQTAPEGREVLSQLVEEYGRLGKQVTIMPEDFEHSTLIRDEGMEDINGIHGMVVPSQYAYYFNSKYLEFQDRDLAVQYVAANIAHEFRHLVNQAQFERISPEAAEAFSLALINEMRARQTGYLVAVRTNKGKATGSTQEAMSLAQDPDAYWDRLKTAGYSQDLDMNELRDPVAAYNRRIAVLEEEAADMKETIAKGLPSTLMALAILSEKEGLDAELKGLREEAAMMAQIYPEELQDTLGTIAQLKKMVRVFQSPRARGDVQYLRMASQAPAFKRLIADYERDQKALVALLRAKPVPQPKRAKGQLGWEEVHVLAAKSQREHPAYWAEFWAKFERTK